MGGGRHNRGVVMSAPLKPSVERGCVWGGRTSQPRGCGVRPPSRNPTTTLGNKKEAPPRRTTGQRNVLVRKGDPGPAGYLLEASWDAGDHERRIVGAGGDPLDVTPIEVVDRRPQLPTTSIGVTTSAR